MRGVRTFVVEKTKGGDRLGHSAPSLFHFALSLPSPQLGSPPVRPFVDGYHHHRYHHHHLYPDQNIDLDLYLNHNPDDMKIKPPRKGPRQDKRPTLSTTTPYAHNATRRPPLVLRQPHQRPPSQRPPLQRAQHPKDKEKAAALLAQLNADIQSVMQAHVQRHRDDEDDDQKQLLLQGERRQRKSLAKVKALAKAKAEEERRAQYERHQRVNLDLSQAIQLLGRIKTGHNGDDGNGDDGNGDDGLAVEQPQ